MYQYTPSALSINTSVPIYPTPDVPIYPIAALSVPIYPVVCQYTHGHSSTGTSLVYSYSTTLFVGN